MKRVIFFAVALIASTVFSAESTSPIQTQSGAADHALTGQTSSAMPLPFTKNIGQWPDSILFRASTNGATMWFTKNGIWYQFFKRAEKAGTTSTPKTGLTYEDIAPVGRDLYGPDKTPDSIVTTMIKAEFMGASDSVQVVGEGELEYRCNYFIGNQPEKWRSDVPNYSAVTMRGIYPGVDVTFSAKEGKLQEKMDARSINDLAQVKVEYHGADVVNLASDNIVTFQTSVGEHRFDGMMLIDRGSSREDERISSASSSASGVQLEYSTYLGGAGQEVGNDIAVDGAGSAYVAGNTYSADFPTSNPLDGVFNGGSLDAFVTRLSSAGNTLVYSTYLGGSGDDYGYGIVVDGAGSAYVTGGTNSSDFPTVAPFDGTLSGAGDAFVTKLSTGGGSLVYSSYLGGSEFERANGIAVDLEGKAHVTGLTSSSDFPTASPFAGTLGDIGYYDVFVTKISATGNSLIYSTYLGGNKEDFVYDIALDAEGSAYLTGFTTSSDFPTVTPFDSTLEGSGFTTDVFVTKLNLSGNTLVYSTYLGGSNAERAYGIVVDGFGSAYVTGETISSDFPTASPFDGTLSGTDAFVTKLSLAGTGLTYSTYLGGSGGDYGYGIVVDGAGSAYVTGLTYSSDFPTAPLDDSSGGVPDAFVTKLSSTGRGLVYSTYLGGSSHDVGYGIALDGAGSAYMTGYSFSSNFPTVSPFDGTLGGINDAVVTKLSPPPPCCTGLTGNVDCDPIDGVDISDLTSLIDYLYITFSPLCCTAEANTDGQPGIDISDLSALIDYLYISFMPPAVCQ